MEQFLRSFVGKVCTHAADGEQQTRHAIEYLMPILRPNAPADVIETVVSSLYTITGDAALFQEEFQKSAGVEVLLGFMADFDCLALTAGCRKDVCRILCTDPPCAAAALAAEDGGVCDRVLGWFEVAIVKDGNLLEKHYAILVHALQQAGVWHMHRSILSVLQRVGFKGNSALVLVDALLECFRQTPEAVSHFYEVDGLDVVCEMAHLYNVSLERTDVCSPLQFLKELCAHDTTGLADAWRKLPVWDNIVHAITMEIFQEEADVRAVVPLLKHPALLETLSTSSLFVDTLLLRAFDMEEVCEEFDQCVQDVASVRKIFSTQRVISGVLRCLRDEALPDVRRLHFASLTAKLIERHEIAPYLPLLLDVLGKTCRTHRDKALELDDLCLTHLDHLHKHPKDLVRPLRMCALPSDLWFHLADTLCGASPNAWMSTTSSGMFVTHKLNVYVRQMTAPLPGEARYVDSLLRRMFCLERVDVPKPSVPSHLRDAFVACPITLEYMHCPVLASDGHTYELSAILQLHRKHVLEGATENFLSPLTREPLKDCVFYNRSLKLMERATLAAHESNKSCTTIV